MQIFIETLTKKTFPSMSIEPTDTIKRIKELFQEIEGIPSDQVRLIYVSEDSIQPLEADDKTAQDYDIREGSTLTMVLKLRGD